MTVESPNTGLTQMDRLAGSCPVTGKTLGGRRLNARSGIRTMLRAFAAASAPPNTLFWDPRLDKEYGAGIKIALLDSGLNGALAMFDGVRFRGRDFTGSGDLFDPSGHGTANAALLVGQNTNRGYGVCHASELLVAKVLGCTNWQVSVRAIAGALRWAVARGADIITLPFGSSRGGQLIQREIRRAAAKGCLIFAAAGNHGPDYIGFPAWLPEVTAVSALTAGGSVSPICSAHEQVNTYIWGDRIPVWGVGGTTELSGSSPATVLAAGITALKLAAERNASAAG